MTLCSLSSKNLKTFIIFYIAVLAILILITPFTQPEANILYATNNHLTNIVAQFFNKIYHNHSFIRLPFFIISLITIWLYKELSKIYINDPIYSNLAFFIFLVTPGVFVSFILVNYATFSIFLTLLFIYSYHKNIKLIQIIVLVLLLFTNVPSFVFYLAIALYTYKKKDWFIFTISIILLIISSLIEAYPINGIPKGHLSQVLAIYGVTLSPFYFFAVIYALYRLALDKQKTLLWYIVTSFFLISILLSFRQKIKITDFTPFVVIASILVVSVYKNSISIRLKIFQKNYKKICLIIVSMLLLETSIITLNYPLYLILGDKFKIIDTSMYTIAQKNNKKCIKSIKNRDKMLYRYYGIKECK